MGASIDSVHADCPRTITRDNLRDLCRSTGAAKVFKTEQAGRTVVQTGNSAVALLNSQNVCGEGTTILASIFRSKKTTYRLVEEDDKHCTYDTALGKKTFMLESALLAHDVTQPFNENQKPEETTPEKHLMSPLCKGVNFDNLDGQLLKIVQDTPLTLGWSVYQTTIANKDKVCVQFLAASNTGHNLSKTQNDIVELYRSIQGMVALPSLEENMYGNSTKK